MKELGYQQLKLVQLEVVEVFLRGRDVVANLTVRIWQKLMLRVLTHKLLATEGTVVLVVTPLIAIMKDQVYIDT